jgi:hypothetical protein
LDVSWSDDLHDLDPTDHVLNDPHHLGESVSDFLSLFS